MSIRKTTRSEDHILIEHYKQMWRDNGVEDSEIMNDYALRTQKFINSARRRLNFAAFVAHERDLIVGSGCCQVYDGLYPKVTKDWYIACGYIWGIYVWPKFRRLGIGRQLTQACITHLTEVGCQGIILHASPGGVSVYEQLGFKPSNEMALKID
jgi:GNAT superfamily N-acetyltransferase